jgi:hypothetical protein
MSKVREEYVRVGGRSVHVIAEDLNFWVSEDDGVATIHLGRLLHKPAATKVLDAPKPCSTRWCKRPSWAGTSPGGRAVHDTCEGWLQTLTDDVFAATCFEVSARLSSHAESDTLVEASALLSATLSARPHRAVHITFPASRLNARVADGIAKAAKASQGPLSLVVRAYNAGVVVELPTPFLVADSVAERLNNAFGPEATSIVEVNRGS